MLAKQRPPACTCGIQAGAVRQQNILATRQWGEVTERNDRDAFSQAVEGIAAGLQDAPRRVPD